MAFKIGGKANGSKSLPQLLSNAIETATDGNTKDAEDWSLYMGICDLINSSEDGPKETVKMLRKRFATKHPQTIILTLSLLETCVKNCGKRFHVQLSNKDFLQDFMKIISPKNNYSVALQNTVLGLLQTWAFAFQSSPELKEICKTYQDLKNKGVDFPPFDPDHASQAFISPKSAPVTRPATEGSCYRKSSHPQQPPSSVSPQPPYAPGSDETRRGSREPVTSLDAQRLEKLRGDLAMVQQNCKVFGELLTEVCQRGAGSPAAQSDLELLEDLNASCRGMQERVLDLIQKIQIDSITEELLVVNDELNNVFLRYDRYHRVTSGQQNSRESGSSKPTSPVQSPATSVGGGATGASSNEVPVCNLIDFNDSPGAEPIATGLANLNLQPATGQKPFDPFSPLEPSKDSMDFSKQGAVNHREYEEMEEWLKENETAAAAASATTTSTEFERFLSERANAASGLPPANQKLNN